MTNLTKPRGILRMLKIGVPLLALGGVVAVLLAADSVRDWNRNAACMSKLDKKREGKQSLPFMDYLITYRTNSDWEFSSRILKDKAALRALEAAAAHCKVAVTVVTGGSPALTLRRTRSSLRTRPTYAGRSASVANFCRTRVACPRASFYGTWPRYAGHLGQRVPYSTCGQDMVESRDPRTPCQRTTKSNAKPKSLALSFSGPNTELRSPLVRAERGARTD